MQTITQLIKAAGTGYNAPVGGRKLLIQSCDAGNVLTITLADAMGNQYTAKGVGAGFSATPDVGFSSIAMTTTADANVQFIVSNGEVDIQLSEVNAVIANPPGAPANVQMQGQGTTSGNPLYVVATGATLTATSVAVNNTSASPVPVSLISAPGAPIPVSGTVSANTTPTQGASVTDQASVNVPAYTSGTPNQVQLIAAGARRALRIGNPKSASGVLVIGSNAVTPSNAAIVLQPGDTWNETDVPQIAWYATSDSGTTANIQVIA